ncbi:MAG: 7-cyano-7-deazaguanine synthase QueC [Dissulfurispiraceae bacterium]|jgi:7-cyano-7-deazaguanine synthase|nr:7-cyano-7-deazaguanine synthase QueC [Dissulfurispiraceae bacterium]
MKKAVVLLSGGLDSATSAAIAKSEGYEIYALSFDYAQRHVIELESAKKLSAHLGVKEHLVINFDMSGIGGSALTSDIDVPKDNIPDGISIPVTYVPARNTIFLSFALGWAETVGAEDIFIGANAIDYSGYPDCRSEYLEAFENMANLATKAGVEGSSRFKIRSPLLKMSKSDIIKTGFRLGLDYALTWSCYDPQFNVSGYAACGRCDSCILRAKGFREAGLTDPA